MTPLSRLLPVFGALTAIVAGARASDFIVVSSYSARGYERTKPGDSKIIPQSYVFAPGDHKTSSTRDLSEEKMPFKTLAATLAPALAKQQYFPATDPTDADLFIVVHWGSTQTYEDPNPHKTQEAFNSAMAAGDVAAINDALSAAASENMTALQFQERNAALLGYKRSLDGESNKMFVSTDELTMRSELQEERYYVVLVAYDYPYMKKNKQKKICWVTHISVRSPGNNFTVAVPEMARAGSDWFGKNMDQLERIETKIRSGRVDVGEPQVIPAAGEAAKPKR